MNKPLILSVIILLSIIALIPIANGQAQLQLSIYDYANIDFQARVQATYPSATVNWGARYQTFTVTQNGYLTYVQVRLKAVGPNAATPSGQLACSIFSTTAASYNSQPNLSLVNASNTILYSSLSNSTYYTATYVFAGTYQLTTGTYYALVFYGVSTVAMDDNNAFSIGADSSTPSYGGYQGYQGSSAWSSPVSTIDLCYEIFGYASAVTPSPSPTPVAGVYNVTFKIATNGVVNDNTGGTIAWNTTTHSGTQGEYYNTWVGYSDNLTVAGTANVGYAYNGQAWIEYDLVPYDNPYTHSYDGRELQIIVDFRNSSGPFPSPTTWYRSPTATPFEGNYWDNNNGDNAGIDWLNSTLPAFMPLLLIIIMAIVGWRFAGTWGFMAGLTLGGILSYVIFPANMPLWGVIGILIVDVLLFWKGRNSE